MLLLLQRQWVFVLWIQCELCNVVERINSALYYGNAKYIKSCGFASLTTVYNYKTESVNPLWWKTFDIFTTAAVGTMKGNFTPIYCTIIKVEYTYKTLNSAEINNYIITYIICWPERQELARNPGMKKIKF